MYQWVNREELERTKNGLTAGYIDFWWVCNNKNEVLLYGNSPIANSNRLTAERLLERYRIEGAVGIVEIPYASIRVKPSDYVQG